MNLFKHGRFLLRSGESSSFKIECDALTADDWTTLAWMIRERVPNYREVVSVPRGGDKLADCLRSSENSAAIHYPRLVVDDVWTNGVSIFKFMRPGDFGYVVFARSPIPIRYPVRALFTLDDGRYHSPMINDHITWPIRYPAHVGSDAA